MFKKILFPSDFSKLSEKALQYVIQLKEAGTEEVVVIHVVDKRALELFSKYSSEDLTKIERKSLETAKVALKPIEQKLKKNGLKVELRVVEGIPVQEILSAEKEEDISAVVLGSHGVSNVEEMFLGSVSEKVIRKSKKPVLVVKR